MEHGGVAHWLPEFLEVKDLILRHASERSATERQLKNLEKRFELGRKNAFEDGFSRTERAEPRDEQELQRGLKVLNKTLEQCLAMLEEK